MLHERTPELAELFEEGKEVACFGSVEELAEKVDFYLAHPEERERIAAAGHRRCVPAYSYEERMRRLLAYHNGDMGIPASSCTGVQEEPQAQGYANRL
jgi:spore maturation protein CgeB